MGLGGAAPGPDRSRAASLHGGADWSCPFPLAAAAEGIDRAQVTLRVQVDATGRARRTTILRDPGHGFAQAARECARQKRFVPATNHSGAAIDSTVTVRVRFVR